MKKIAQVFIGLIFGIGLIAVLIMSCKKKSNAGTGSTTSTSTTGSSGTSTGGTSTTGGSGCPTTAACGCSAKSKAECEAATDCCKWTVGSGCGCK